MDHLQEFERIARFEADYFEVDIPRDKPTITIVELDPTLKPDDKNAPQISCYDAKPNIIYVPKNPDPTVMPEHTTQWLHSKNNTRLRRRLFMIDSFTEATGYLIQEDLPDVPPEVISKLLREISKSKK